MLAFRRIRKELVEQCIKNPDSKLPAKEGKIAYFKDLGKNYLKVIVAEVGKDFVVITPYWFAKKKVRK